MFNYLIDNTVSFFSKIDTSEMILPGNGTCITSWPAGCDLCQRGWMFTVVMVMTAELE